MKKNNVRSGIRTHAYRCRLRPERSALDRSAILTLRELGSRGSKALPPHPMSWSRNCFKTFFFKLSSLFGRQIYLLVEINHNRPGFEPSWPRACVLPGKEGFGYKLSPGVLRFLPFIRLKTFVRCGIRTHAHIRGPERSS